MPSPTTKSVFWHGIRDGAPFILVLIPFSTLFGVVAAEAGLSVFEALTFSVMVLAGAAQFAALQLLVEDAPTLIAIITALAVNLRMAMYSAALTPHLGAAPLWQRAVAAYFVVDQTYACSVVEYEKNRDWGMACKLAYFFGVAAPVVPFWYGSTVVGAGLGAGIPDSLALDFAVPITFLAIITPMLRTPAHVAAAIVAVIMSLVFAFLPYSLGILVAGFLGMMTGAQVELRLDRRTEGGT
ncbi:AzlC family ABC transporter permease [Roseovarius sp. 2305UL8-3]|uniref:AzlC family ABC transporter permease n=1 Tax=Roseovarius conchicola TaxID=3121636 RepID=UPI003528F4E9